MSRFAVLRNTRQSKHIFPPSIYSARALPVAIPLYRVDLPTGLSDVVGPAFVVSWSVERLKRGWEERPERQGFRCYGQIFHYGVLEMAD